MLLLHVQVTVQELIVCLLVTAQGLSILLRVNNLVTKEGVVGKRVGQYIKSIPCLEFLKAGGTRRHQQGMTGGKTLTEGLRVGQMVMNSRNDLHKFSSFIRG
ncbi:hypothetical protein L798_01004 [Zootermopsis nevadensis]|uniref:Uncharacterized protein n=1 Tax=Zootermopsis nevadensis TaxID=136037 RepID=A0A067RSC5_ZOONE|nr:hypothetical protein L798_01004 [Zootermopsis nevadensis]